VRLEAPRERAFGAVLAHAPEYGDAELREFGRGLDHRVFIVRDLVVRLANPASAAAVLGEAELLRLVDIRVSVPVPKPVFADPLRGTLAYRLLPGRPLAGGPSRRRLTYQSASNVVSKPKRRV
jgi:hypothetical protein